MQTMIDEGVQVDSIVTDPPYELGFMGKSWDSTGIAFQKETWELALQLLKPGGHLLAFGGSRTYHRMAVAIENAGFEIRDQIMWLYGSGFPKSRNIGKDMEKRKVGGIKNLKKIGEKKGIKVETGTQGYSYSKEYVPGISMGGKQISGDIPVYEITNEYAGWGIALKPAHEPVVMARKPLEGTCADNVLKHGTGGINIDECRVTGEDTKGRFPANVMHDGSEEATAGFPHDSKKFFYCPKVSKTERNSGCSANKHPTVKPIDLMKYLCRLVTPPGGVVLDPFMGSGSTGLACKDEGFDFIGIEREKDYYAIAEQRINSSAPLMDFLK